MDERKCIVVCALVLAPPAPRESGNRGREGRPAREDIVPFDYSSSLHAGAYNWRVELSKYKSTVYT